MKKGFTLIELLAVIVILAIIALIATPIVLNIIEKTKEGAAKTSALGYIDAVKNQVVVSLMDNDSTLNDGAFTTEQLESKGVIVSGSKPSEGWVKLIDSNVVGYSLKINGYVINYDGNITIIKDGDVLDMPSDQVGLKPGLYNSNDELIKTWEELEALGITKESIEMDYATITDSPHSGIFGDNNLEGKLVLPNTITTIGNGAFYNCSTLLEVVIPKSVTNIGNNAFNKTGLVKVIIPNSVLSIGIQSFGNSKSLESVTFEENTKLTSIGKSAFVNDSNLSAIVIPNGITSIGETSFYKSGLVDIVFPSSVVSISRAAFNGTPWLESKRAIDPLVIVNNILLDATTVSGDVIIPEGITVIGDKAFYGNENVTSVTITNAVTEIGYYAFGGTKLASITIPESVKTIGIQAFQAAAYLTDITFEQTSGWKVGDIELSSDDLSNTKTAARYLTATYYGSTWTRSE